MLHVTHPSRDKLYSYQGDLQWEQFTCLKLLVHTSSNRTPPHSQLPYLYYVACNSSISIQFVPNLGIAMEKRQMPYKKPQIPSFNVGL